MNLIKLGIYDGEPFAPAEPVIGWNQVCERCGDSTQKGRLYCDACRIDLASHCASEVPALPQAPTWKEAIEAGKTWGDAIKADKTYASSPRCTLPPSGWRCTRAGGHDGPCAAIPTSEAIANETIPVWVDTMIAQRSVKLAKPFVKFRYYYSVGNELFAHGYVDKGQINEHRFVVKIGIGKCLPKNV